MALDVPGRRLRALRESSARDGAQPLVPSSEVLVGVHGEIINTKTVFMQAPIRCLYLNGDLRPNSPMKSINQIRRERLRELVKRFDDGKTARFTERMKWKSPSLATRYLTDSPKNNKPIGTAIARAVEVAYGVEENYLDNLPGRGVEPGTVEGHLLAMFSELSTDGKRNVLGYVHEFWLRERGNAAPQFGPTVFEEDVRERREVAEGRPTKKRPAARTR